MKKENIISLIICIIAFAISIYFYTKPAILAGAYQLGTDGIVVVKGMLIIFSLSIAIYISRLFGKE